MFPFSNSYDEEDNTPFFQDNSEETSIFNSETQQEFSAFDLFNSQSNNKFNSNCFGVIEESRETKQKQKSSKKSLIMELDEFDRNQSFNDIERKYQQEQSKFNQSDYANSNFMNFGESNAYQSKNQLQESRVERFDKKFMLSSNNQSSSNQFENFKKSSFAKVAIPNLKKSKQKQFNFGFNLKNKNEVNKQSTKLTKNVNYNTNKQQKQLVNTDQKQYLLKNKNSQIKIQVEAQTQVLNIPEEEYSFRGELRQKKSNKPNFIFRKKTSPQINAQTEQKNSGKIQTKDLQKHNQIITKLGQQKSQKHLGQKNSKFSFLSNPLTSKPNNQALRKSKVQQIQSKRQKLTQNKQLIITNQQTQFKQHTNKLSSNKFQFGSFNNILRKSEAKQANFGFNQKKQQNQMNHTNTTNEDSKKSIQIDVFKNKKIYGRNEKQLLNATEITSNDYKQKYLQQKEKQDIQIQQNDKGQHFIIHKQQNFNTNKQKKQQLKDDLTIRPKEKPCFNLKLIKEPFKLQNAAKKEREKEKKNQYSKVVQQQIKKRDDIATTIFLKPDNISKGFAFPNQKFSAGQQQTTRLTQKSFQSQNKTPKITRIQLKKDKQMMINRQTQKFVKPKQLEQQNPANILEPDRQQLNEQSTKRIREHMIDYQKYEDQMFMLNEEIEQTKKKYSNCQDGYKDIFLLLNKANLILSGRYMSQIQSNQGKQYN